MKVVFLQTSSYLKQILGSTANMQYRDLQCEKTDHIFQQIQVCLINFAVGKTGKAKSCLGMTWGGHPAWLIGNTMKYV